LPNPAAPTSATACGRPSPSRLPSSASTATRPTNRSPSPGGTGVSLKIRPSSASTGAFTCPSGPVPENSGSPADRAYSTGTTRSSRSATAEHASPSARSTCPCARSWRYSGRTSSIAVSTVTRSAIATTAGAPSSRHSRDPSPPSAPSASGAAVEHDPKNHSDGSPTSPPSRPTRFSNLPAGTGAVVSSSSARYSTVSPLPFAYAPWHTTWTTA
jgi:hypothetical protein